MSNNYYRTEWQRLFNYGYGRIQIIVLGGFPQVPKGRLHLPSPTYICRVDVKIRLRVKGVKRIPIWIRRYHYAIEEIFTSANMIMIELDK